MTGFPKIKGLLFDLDGVLYVGSRVIGGAIDAVERIRVGGIPCRFVTNTSTLSLDSPQQKNKFPWLFHIQTGTHQRAPGTIALPETATRTGVSLFAGG